MKVYLLDINMLLALLWANHAQHEIALQWFRKSHKSGWATCPLTQAGFVRVSSNPRVLPDAPSPAKAIEVLETNLALPSHHFWKDELPFAKAVAPFAGRLTGHQQATDAYLLGLSIHHDGVLATFDEAISDLLERKSPHRRCLEIVG